MIDQEPLALPPQQRVYSSLADKLEEYARKKAAVSENNQIPQRPNG